MASSRETEQAQAKKKLRSVRLRRFKRIDDAPFDLADVNVLVGANNSGKSSIIQGIHFGIGVLQTLALTNRLSRDAASLNPSELVYSPSEWVYSLGHGGDLYEDRDQAIEVQYNLVSGDQCAVQIRKGRNRNINVSVTNTDVAKTLASLERPFSIFSPGLAGIAKTETYVSDGVLFRALARGDANVVLRNILLRLSNKGQEWAAFLEDLHEVFPDIELAVTFDSTIDEYIQARIVTENEDVPIELVGTGILQATQILSYIHTFAPTIVVLDEPDSHLHPNNQRLLCALLRQIAEDRDTQVVLTTHSRHVVDALASSANMLWVRNATVDTASPDDEIGILLDIGALDIKERVGTGNTKVVVLSEDDSTQALETILKANGFKMEVTEILPYFGATSIKNLRPLVRMIHSANAKAKIILHRDLDYLDDDQKSQWEKTVRAMDVEPFVTCGTTIESHLLNAAHLAELNLELTEEEFVELIETVAEECNAALSEKFVNGHIDVARQQGTHVTLNHGALAARAPERLAADPDRYRCGKTMLSGVRRVFRARINRNLRTMSPTNHLTDEVLSGIAQKVFGKKRHKE